MQSGLCLYKLSGLRVSTLKSVVVFSLVVIIQFMFHQRLFSQDTKYASVVEQAHIETNIKPWDRFSVSLGGFFAGFNSGISVGSSQLGVGVILDIEDALGLDITSFAYRGNVNYRFGKSRKQALVAGYFGINRNAVKVLEEELDLGDQVYPVGTKISSKYDFSIIRLKYDYSFYQDKRVSIGASIGLFIMPVNFKVSPQNTEAKVSDFVAPLPLIGLRTSFHINGNLYLLQSAELLYLSFADFKGSLLDLNIRLEHKTFNHFGFGIGVNTNRVDVSITNTDSNIKFFGDIWLAYTGVLFYGTYFF